MNDGNKNKRHRGRTASCPTTPAQIPACGIIAPGFSEVFASAQTSGDAHDCALGTTYTTWFSNAKPFHQLIKANPIVTLTLAAPIEKFPQRPDGIKIERIETRQVAIYTEVIIVVLATYTIRPELSGKKGGVLLFDEIPT